MSLNPFDSYKFKRPYCEGCKVIYGKRSIGLILSCQKCGSPLILKNFNPYIKLFAGLGIIFLGCLTFLVKEFPIMWIGGFIGGLLLIANGFTNWQNVKELDGEKEEQGKNIFTKLQTAINSRKFTITRCLKCGQKLRVPKTRKVLNVTCPKCKYSFKRIGV